MAEETKKPDTIKPPEPFKFNDVAWKDKLSRLDAARDAVAGKENYNPFIWYAKHIKPLLDLYKKGDRTKELFDSLQTVSETVPVLDPDWVKQEPPKGPPMPRRA